MEENQNDVYVSFDEIAKLLNDYFADFLDERGIPSFEQASVEYRWHLDGIIKAMEMLYDVTDKVELVRCSKCKYYGKVDDKFYRKNTCLNPHVQMKPTPTSFCSEGKRREG